MASDPVVRIRSLCKDYRIQRTWKEAVLHPRRRDVRTALQGIDLDVERGEFLGVLGENGAGKTTLFKILATLVRPDRGTASVDGHDVVESGARVRQVLIPVIPTERSLYWRLSAQENLRLYGSLYGLGGADSKRRVSEVLEIVGLQDVGRKQVGLFSSGMKQRLLIGRALLGRPKVLLLDEPTRSLDPLSARDFRSFLKSELGDRQGATILLATHDHEEATELCDRVAVLDEGHLVAVGRTDALLSSSRVRVCSIWTSDAENPELERAVEFAGGRVRGVEPISASSSSGREEWRRVRIEVATDEAGAADLLASITRAGIPVSRFTRDDLTLADLLERVKSEESGFAEAASEGRSEAP